MKEEHLATTAPKRVPLHRRLLARAHLAAPAVVGLLWVLHLAGVLFQPPEELARVHRRVDALNAEVRRALEDEGSFRGERETLEALEQAVVRSWGALPGEAPLPEGDLTYSDPVLKARWAGLENRVVFNPPRDLRARAQMGRIVLEWVDDGKNNVPVTGYVVMRGKGDTPPSDYARVEGGEQSFADKDVTAGVRYTYRVAAVTEDPVVPPDARRSAPGAPASARAISDLRITLIDGDAGTGEATFKVEKWHEGAWFSRRFSVKEGEELGAPDTGAGVDFSTGLTLQSLSVEEGSETRTVSRVVFGPTGRVQLEGGRPVMKEVPVTEEFVEVTAVLGAPGRETETYAQRQKT